MLTMIDKAFGNVEDDRQKDFSNVEKDDKAFSNVEDDRQKDFSNDEKDDKSVQQC